MTRRQPKRLFVDLFAQNKIVSCFERGVAHLDKGTYVNRTLGRLWLGGHIKQVHFSKAITYTFITYVNRLWWH